MAEIVGRMARAMLCSGILCLAATAASAQIGGPPDQPDTPVDAATRIQAVNALVDGLEKIYVFPDVADKIVKKLKDQLKRGAYDKITSSKEFARAVSNDMREIAHDGHLNVHYSAQPVPPETPPGQQPAQLPADAEKRMAKDNFRFEKVERLDGNIGYLKFNGFVPASLGGATVAGAMAFLANTDAMIIDLRDNGGGAPSMVAFICSYFFPAEPVVHLNDLEWRKAGVKEYRTEQWWTLPFVPGQRYVGKEVYILTSKKTFSAAEEFTYNMKTQKRATLVGETTGGGANPGGMKRLGEHFAAFIPAGHAVNPITKTNWEGKGIEPDIAAPVADALKVAHQTALDHLKAR